MDGISSRNAIEGSYSEYWTQIVNRMLELVTNALAKEGVVIVGATNHVSAGAKAVPLQLPPMPGQSSPILMRVMEQMDTEDGWVPLGAVGNQLANLASDFDPRTFGYRKASDLVRQTKSRQPASSARRTSSCSISRS